MIKAPEETPQTPPDLEEIDETIKKARELTGSSEKNAERPEEEAKEKPRPKDLAEVFGDVDNRGLFEKLSDKTKNFASGFYERAKTNIADRAEVMFSDKLLDWHHEKAVKLKFKLEESGKDVERLETQKKHHDALLEKYKKESWFSPKLAVKVERERMDFQKEIDKEKAGADRIHSKLEYRNQKKVIYENKRNAICEKIVERVDKRLEPLEEKMGILKSRREQLSLEIENFKEEQGGFSKKIKELEEDIKKSPYKTERKVLRVYLKETKKAFRTNEKLIEEKSKRGEKTDKKIAKVDKKANPWRDQREKFVRITKRELAETPVERRKKGRIEFEKKEVEGTTRAPEEEKPKEKEVKPGEEGKIEEEAGAEAEKEEIRLTIGDFIENWNNYFGSEMPLSQKRIEEVLGTEYKVDEEMDLDSFLKELRAYYILGAAEKKIKKLKEKDFQKYFEVFRNKIES